MSPQGGQSRHRAARDTDTHLYQGHETNRISPVGEISEVAAEPVLEEDAERGGYARAAILISKNNMSGT